MKKYIEISEETIIRLESGNSLDGSLKMDLKTRRITFKAWNRKAPKRYKEKKIKDLDFGWLGETKKHITRHEKFPKIVGYSYIRSAMDRDNIQSKGAITDKEILEFI